MANEFKIVISATDKATSSVKKINDSISKMTRPFNNVQRSMGSLGKELGRNPAVKALRVVGVAAGGVAINVAKLGVSLAAVVGVGSVAGVAALANEWGHLGFEVSKTATGLGMATSDLQSLRGAAQLAGVSTEELTGGLKTLGDTMEDALFGRNQNAVLLLNKIGVGIHKTADGSIDAARGFKDIATYISNIKSAQIQGLVARQFGLEAALPLLRKGAKGIEEYQAKIAEMGGVSTKAGIDAAEQFGLQLNYLSAASNGLKITIGSALVPALQPMIAGLTQWISLNREAIGQKIGEWAKNFGEWIKNVDWDKFIERIKIVGNTLAWVIDKVGELGQKLEKLSDKNPLTYIFGGVPRILYDLAHSGPSTQSQNGQTSSGVIKQNPAVAAANALAGDPRQPLGIRTNNPLNMQPGGRQATFASAEEGISAGVQNIIRKFQGLTLAQFVHKYAPGDGKGNTPATEAAYLANLSASTGIQPNQVPNLNSVSTLAPLISAMIKHENGKNPYDKDMINNTVQHAMEITLTGLPQGTTATAKVKNGAEAAVRINHSMPIMAAG